MDLISSVKTGVMLVPMVLPEDLVTVGLHKFSLNWLQNYSGKLLYQQNFWYNMVRCNFLLMLRLYNTDMTWYCRVYLSTGLWKCNWVFDRGDGLFYKLLCTTEGRIASCAGYQMGLEYGWLCTTGTDSDFCAGNLFLFSQSQMSLMSNVAESVIGTKIISSLIIANSFVEIILYWACWLFPGTGSWSGDVAFCRLLCTTEGRVASCAGHQVGFGWLCTTGTDPNFCAGMMYWIMQPQMNLMIMRLLGADGLLVWFYGYSTLADLSIYGAEFVSWLGYGVFSFYWSWASFTFIFWYSMLNKPCTLFPCSKFSHWVFIWQGFLMRQGYWRFGNFDDLTSSRSDVAGIADLGVFSIFVIWDYPADCHGICNLLKSDAVVTFSFMNCVGRAMLIWDVF